MRPGVATVSKSLGGLLPLIKIDEVSEVLPMREALPAIRNVVW